MIFQEPSSPARILIVDDNQSIHEDFRKILVDTAAEDQTLNDLEAALFGDKKQTFSCQTYRVDFASQGQEALTMVEQAEKENEPYSLAFVDGRMPPGWDGIETIARLWQVSPELQAVLCTAYADYSWEEIQQALGDTDSLVILKKPFDVAEVLQMTHALTRKWDLNRQIQGRLQKLAYFDSLTGLPNREYFLQALRKSLATAQQKQRKGALLFIDLDDFKRINDTLGHMIGDQLLKIIAKRLANCIRQSDLLCEGVTENETARLGGDEFTVLLPNIGSEDKAIAVAERICNALAKPVDLEQHQMMVTPSIGIALFPQDGRDSDTLMKNADMAMYFAKRKGPKNYRFFQESMNAEALKRLTIETQLRHALERNEFSLAYQPQIDLNTGRTTGLEALLRWHNQELGQVPPMEFIPVAEATGLIHKIGEWVMRSACRQAKTWQDQGIDVPRMGINISPREFVHPDFLSRVVSALSNTGLEPKCLLIEITETLLMEHYEWATRALTSLSDMGVQVAIDDFGKGYSSLHRLQTLTIDCLKIDRAFVSGINMGFREKSVLNAIITMANSMNLGVIAEGVETESQFKFLKENQCGEAQGYMLSMPMTVEETEAFFKQNNHYTPDSAESRPSKATSPYVGC